MVSTLFFVNVTDMHYSLNSHWIANIGKIHRLVKILAN